MKKWITVFTYIVLTLAAIIFKQQLLDWIQYGHISLLIVTLLAALIPVIPYGVVGGIIGVKYGLLIGSFINLSISTFAAALMFFLVRGVFKSTGRNYLTRYNRIEKLTSLFEKNAFLSILSLRMLPFVPAQIVNIFSAISQVSFGSFLLATLVGKIPVMLVYTLIGKQVVTDSSQLIVTIGLYGIFLLIVYGIYRYWLKKSVKLNES
ncbi:TVP38/TMEM64 family protein [Paenibacillus alginolyticus]|uniref:TVP38/TMEM64 family membrane protein n=1 Tax=Paenibacillus alginolyticus TaxID=59839 RepID=A0ABT4GB43_9BACL|nr:VTT domain-containing protein [Paenibacillus alginolyticus]MCY9693398.1 VTT domain-containing protein [Paenibacillus alginolyticus]MEC0144657.1 VTT domain-containing protein [Paenibacillus alginolyticus]